VFINYLKVWYFFEVVIMYFHLPIFIDASVGIDILIPKYKGEGGEGCGLSKTFVMQIFIFSSVGIDILILKYKGEKEEGCILSKKLVIKIKESTTYFHLFKCQHLHPHSKVKM
jgi:hypothetical protein